jgi:hypothetical protein
MPEQNVRVAMGLCVLAEHYPAVGDISPRIVRPHKKAAEKGQWIREEQHNDEKITVRIRTPINSNSLDSRAIGSRQGPQRFGRTRTLMCSPDGTHSKPWARPNLVMIASATAQNR